MGDDGGLSDLRLFVNQGGEGVATDSEGNVYIGAGDIFVYDPSGTPIETIPVPGRPTQSGVRRARTAASSSSPLA